MLPTRASVSEPSDEARMVTGFESSMVLNIDQLSFETAFILVSNYMFLSPRWSPMDHLALGQTKPESRSPRFACCPLGIPRSSPRGVLVLYGTSSLPFQTNHSMSRFEQGLVFTINPASDYRLHLQHRVLRSLPCDTQLYPLRLRDVGPCDAVQAEPTRISKA